MKHILHIHNDNRFTWVQLSDAHEILAAQEINHLAALGNVKTKDQWVVLIPGQHVLLTTVNLPKTNRRELQKAIPFALEEQVISEVDKLYFALGNYSEEGHLAVAAIDKKVFENYLRLLKSYQISPNAIVPDFLAIPYTENRWSVVINDEMALFRLEKQQGFSTYHNNIRLLIQLTLEKHKDHLPEKINVYNISKFNRKNMQVANHQVPIENISSNNLFNYSEIFQQPDFNLLQNQYRPKIKLSTNHRQWLYVLATAAAWLLIFIGGKMVIWYDLKNRTHHLQQTINAEFQQIFPGIQNTDDPRRQIEQELQALIRNSQNARFINLLGRTATTLNHYPQINLQSINYQNDQMILTLTTNTLDQLAQLTHALNSTGLTVKQTKMTNDNKQLTAELLIK